MATSYQQPLLNPSSNTKKPTSSKTFLYLFLSLVAVICPVALLSAYLTTTTTHSDPLSSSQVCTHAHDQNSCLSFVTPLVEDSTVKFSEIDLLKKFLNISISHIENAMTLSNKLGNRVNDMREKAALADCVDLMDSSIGRTLDSMSILSKSPSQKNYFDAQTWLSSVLTNHVTCLDELPESSEIKTHLEILIARARTSLAILTSAMASTTENDNFLTRSLNGKFPSWVTHRDRKLLSGSNAAVNADLVVAKDGSGNYKTIKEAVAAAPNNSKVRYTIYIKKGTYKEQVEIPKIKKNLMLTGDSMDLTIITGSLNVADGSTTFKSATLIVGGDGFIAQDLWIQNTAGAVKHQAVALRVSADLVVINRCRIDAYQDSLYTHTLRQFYRDCFITGTVDFIFGDAAVVLQKCQLTPRKPMAGQGNMVTAQGRTDPNSNTGISIQNCDILPSSELAPVQANFKTYLGRPWKEYSRTVIMQTNIGDVIHPAGWSIWTGDFALKTLYYGEYMNRGAGAGTSKRVTWPGYHPALSTSEANKFTVASLIQGGVWLKSTGVAYTEGL